jgi:clan AA aspartic protease
MRQQMGMFSEEIILSNVKDEALASAGMRQDVRQVTLKAVVDTGAMSLYIDEGTCQRLGLEVSNSPSVRVADGRPVQTKATSPVKIRWKDRYMICSARVLEGAEHTLLGAIPLEQMDLMVDPVNQRLVGTHGDVWLEELSF